MTTKAVWPAGGGKTGAWVRAQDWSGTAFGPIAAWPPCLKTAVDICLASPTPVSVLWGKQHLQLYNDAYAETVAGTRHPRIFGAPSLPNACVDAALLRPVANDMKIVYPGRPWSDAQIAQSVRQALEWDALVPEQKIQSTVEEGWVTLKGSVCNWSERNDAEKAIRNLSGIRGVTNNITIVYPKPDPDPSVIRRAIEAAIDRQTDREINSLGIAVKAGTVTLTGKVRSWREKVAATGAASFAPSIRHVENHLIIDPYL